jgi:hypothetical protein
MNDWVSMLELDSLTLHVMLCWIDRKFISGSFTALEVVRISPKPIIRPSKVSNVSFLIIVIFLLIRSKGR